MISVIVVMATQPSMAEKKLAQAKEEKLRSFLMGLGQNPRIDVEGKDRFPINRDSESI